MTKLQKVWIGVLLAIVLVPEILFQSTSRLIYGVLTIKDITFGRSYTVVLIQALSALVLAISLFVFRKKIQQRWLSYLFIGLLLLWAVVGYLTYYDALYSKISIGNF